MFIPGAQAVDHFLRADAPRLRDQVVLRQAALAWLCIAIVIAGAGLYGAVMGCWRSFVQAIYTGIKLPMVFLLTTLGNGLLNGMLAPLLGLNLSFRQSLVVILVSFAIASVILAGLSPVALFLVWNTPPLGVATQLSSPEYGFMQLSLAIFIAFAGIVGNVRLLPLLQQWGANRAVARNVLLAWLTVNLLLGSQVCWVLRPFIWDPAGREQFIGRQYFRGSFYETIFEAGRRLIFSGNGAREHNQQAGENL
jgi:hypothetical protein